MVSARLYYIDSTFCVSHVLLSGISLFYFSPQKVHSSFALNDNVFGSIPNVHPHTLQSSTSIRDVPPVQCRSLCLVAEKTFQCLWGERRGGHLKGWDGLVWRME